MRIAAISAVAFAVVGCTAPNPDFGESSTTRADTSAGTSAETSTSTTMSTSVSSDPTDPTDPTTDPATSSGQVDPVTTGEPSFECCDDTDCSSDVLDCVCNLAAEDCCSGSWGDTCAGIAIACGGVCDGAVYSCCEPQNMAACTGVQNVGGFCFAHPSCCLVQWEASCIPDYDEATGECGLESCELPHASPGCDDAEIIKCVCDELPQCCTEQWHEQCVAAAMNCG